MATSRAQFEATVKADTSGAVAEFNRAGASIDKAMDRASKSTERLDNAMVKMARGAVGGVAFGQIVQFSKQLVNSTAQLEDTIAAAGVTFGEYSKEIEDFGKSAAKNFGISQRAAVDAANTFAALGKSAGVTGADLADFSTEMVGLAGDLASFRGTSVEDAIAAIGSGLRGEAEPLRRFGILLDDATLKAEALTMGLYDGKGALTAQQKVLAAQSVILKQSTDAQGDFNRTADSTANSLKTAAAEMENAKAAAGQALAPAMTALAQAVTPVLQGFAELPSELQTVITLMPLTAGAFASGSQALQGLGVATKTANLVMGGLVGTIGIAATAYSLYSQSKAEATRQTQAFIDALNLEGPEQDSAIQQLANSDKDFRAFIDALNATGLSLADVEQYARTGTGAFAEYFGTVAQYGGMARGGPGRLARELGVSEDAFIRVLSAVSNLRGEQLKLAGTTGAVTLAANGNLTTENLRARALRDVANRTRTLKGVTDEQRTAVEQTTSQIKTANEAYKDQLDLIERLYGDQRTAIQRQRDYSDAQKEFMSTVGDSSATLDQQVESVITLSEQYATLNGASLDSEEGTRRQIESLNTLLGTLDPSSALFKAILEYTAAITKIPTDVKTLLSLGVKVGDVIGSAGIVSTGGLNPTMVKTATGDIVGGRMSSAPVVLNVTVNRPVATGEQIANELAAYIRRNGTAFLYRY